jgi:hypothetical protein
MLVLDRHLYVMGSKSEYWILDDKRRFIAEFCRRIRNVFKQYVCSSWNHSTNLRSTSNCSYLELLKFVKCNGVLMLILPSQNISFACVDVIFRRGNSTHRLSLTCFSTFAHVPNLLSPDMRCLNIWWRNSSMHPPWSIREHETLVVYSTTIMWIARITNDVMRS